MHQYLIMCRSLTYAQGAARALERAGITAFVMRAPHGASSQGCSYGVRVSERSLNDAINILNQAGIAFGIIYRLNPSGFLEEVVRV